MTRSIVAYLLCLIALDARSALAQQAPAYARLPLSFEANVGQTDARVKFLSRGAGQTLFLTPTEAVLLLKGSETPLRLSLVGASMNAEIAGVDRLRGTANYFTGNDPSRWRTNVSTYGKVRYGSIYPGIDLVFYGNPRQIEFDFVLAPGADASRIRIAIRGARPSLDDRGNAVVQIGGQDLQFQKPRLYQDVDGRRQAVAGEYVVKGHELRFRVGRYDRRRPLVIDPVLVYSTFLGGSDQDGGNAIAVDSAGNAYVTGIARSSDFPVSPGAYQTSGAGVAFVTKLDPSQSGAASRVYSTYLGGSGSEGGFAIAVDGANDAYITGITNSIDFPVTATAFQSNIVGAPDGFLTKLNAAGNALLYSTYFGGTFTDYPLAVAIDGSGNAYVTGYTDSQNFPVSPGAFQSTNNVASLVNTAFVAKFDPSGSGAASRVYATYLGGTNASAAYGIAVDASGHAYVTGHTFAPDFPMQNALQATCASCPPPSCGVGGVSCSGYPDVFVSKMNSAGTGQLYSTFIGGSYDDFGRAIAVDGAGNAYITGSTASGLASATTPFPITAGAFQSVTTVAYDAFITKVNAGGGAPLAYSSLLGGTSLDEGVGIALDAAANAYVVGYTASTDFPISLDAFQTALNGTGAATIYEDAFVAMFDLTKAGAASRVYATYLGGSSREWGFSIGAGIAVDAAGNAYVTGSTISTDFPVTTDTAISTAAFQPTTTAGFEDAFVAKIATCPPLPGMWAPTGSLPAGRMAQTSTRLSNGKVLIAGGLDVATSLDNPLASALLYDPATGMFTATGSMITPRFRHTATLLPDGKVLIGGGVTTGSGGVCTNTAELYDPSANGGAGAFTSAGTMDRMRGDYTATLLPNGKVLLAGGSCSGGSTAEIYDPASNTFTPTGSMSAIRVGHTATLLANGKVLIVGGMDTIASVVLDSAEIFDPAANSGAGAFSGTGSMLSARQSHRAVLLPGGAVLVAGGLDSSVQAMSSAEIFTPATGTFASTGGMSVGRSAFTATRLANGKVLVTGGVGAGFFSSAELFDPAASGGAGGFIATGSMTTPREQHSATLLPNGRVLVAGGTPDGPSVLSSAELYTPTVCAPFNTPAGSNVAVQPADTTTGQMPVTVTFSSVTQPGTTSLTMNVSGPAPPANFQLGTGVYYHIETSATYSGPVTVCIDYSGTPLAGTATQPSFGHYDSATGLWQMMTVTSWDQLNNVICGTVTSLSPFALLVPASPPSLQVSLSPAMLSRPNHRLVPITATIRVRDDSDPAPVVTLVSIESNQPDNGLGDGDTSGDIQDAAIGTDDRSFLLRAERAGGRSDRIYTVTYRARNSAGVEATATAEVRVPSSQRN